MAAARRAGEEAVDEGEVGRLRESVEAASAEAAREAAAADAAARAARKGDLAAATLVELERLKARVSWSQGAFYFCMRNQARLRSCKTTLRLPG